MKAGKPKKIADYFLIEDEKLNVYLGNDVVMPTNTIKLTTEGFWIFKTLDLDISN